MQENIKVTLYTTINISIVIRTEGFKSAAEFVNWRRRIRVASSVARCKNERDISFIVREPIDMCINKFTGVILEWLGFARTRGLLRKRVNSFLSRVVLIQDIVRTNGIFVRNRRKIQVYDKRTVGSGREGGRERERIILQIFESN